MFLYSVWFILAHFKLQILSKPLQSTDGSDGSVADFEDVLVTVSFLLRRNPGAQFWTTYQERRWTSSATLSSLWSSIHTNNLFLTLKFLLSLFPFSSTHTGARTTVSTDVGQSSHKVAPGAKDVMPQHTNINVQSESSVNFQEQRELVLYSSQKWHCRK